MLRLLYAIYVLPVVSPETWRQVMSEIGFCPHKEILSREVDAPVMRCYKICLSACDRT